MLEILDMDKVKISIIVPVYNAEESLDRCLHSILDQDFSSYEVVLVDDGSADASSLICDRYSSTDPRFITLHQPNKGVSAARNAGINMANGEYVMFLDSDDALLPYALDNLLDGACDEDIIVGGYGIFINGVPGKEIKPALSRSYKGNDCNRFFEENLHRNCVMLDSPWAKLFRRKTIGNTRFDETLSYAEDKLFVFEMLYKMSSVRTVSHAVYAYYVHSGSLGSDISSDTHITKLRQFLPKYIALLETLCTRFPSVPKIQSLYHNDVVGRYLCRILNIFSKRQSEHLNEEFLSWVYTLMDADKHLGVFSLRSGQVPNMILYKLKKIPFSIKVYRAFVRINKFFCHN
jgi:glycosyltransferase involved in cell wall biosynthesis